MPDEVIISLGPVIIDSGFADGEFIRIEQESDDTEDVAGTDGEVTVSRTNDGRATITFLLMQTSIANDGLSTLSNLTRSAPNMAGAIVPLLISDPNGRALFEAANAWVARPPDRSYDRTPQANEWKIRCAKLVRFDGGS
jgi:hypothetical protein